MAVSVQILEQTTGKRLFVKLLYLSTSGDEAAVTKIDASALGIPEDGSATIKKIMWSIAAGGNNVELIWDGDTDSTIAYLDGTGTWDFETGIPIPNNAVTPTGDVVLTTTGFTGGDSYTIFIEFRIK